MSEQVVRILNGSLKEERVLKQRPEESYSEGDSTLINPKTNEKSDVLNLIHSITYTHSVF